MFVVLIVVTFRHGHGVTGPSVAITNNQNNRTPKGGKNCLGTLSLNLLIFPVVPHIPQTW